MRDTGDVVLESAASMTSPLESGVSEVVAVAEVEVVLVSALGSGRVSVRGGSGGGKSGALNDLEKTKHENNIA